MLYISKGFRMDEAPLQGAVQAEKAEDAFYAQNAALQETPSRLKLEPGVTMNTHAYALPLQRFKRF